MKLTKVIIEIKEILEMKTIIEVLRDLTATTNLKQINVSYPKETI